MEKLARDDLGLDLAGYKDYVHNLKEFAGINNDFGILAVESLYQGQGATNKELLRVKLEREAAAFEDGSKGAERVERHSASVQMSLAKLLREYSSYLNARDRAALKDLDENFALYVLNDIQILDLVGRVHRK